MVRQTYLLLSSQTDFVLGQTIHAWGAIAPTVEDVNKLERDIRCAKPALARWKKTVVLVIDEGDSYAWFIIVLRANIYIPPSSFDG